MLIGVSAFIESLVLIGAFVPAVAILFSLGVAAGAAKVSIWLCLASAFIGAVSGDTLSFLLGRHFHQPLMRRRPFSTHPHWIDKGERFFAQYGLFGIIIGRFFGPLRAVMPFIAGFLEMSITKFILIDLFSALAWAPFYLLPGYLIGANVNTILPANLSTLTLWEWGLLGLFLLATGWILLCIRRKRGQEEIEQEKAQAQDIRRTPAP